MIRLVKGPVPEVLARNGERWTQSLIGMLAAGDEPTEYLLSRYSRPEIKRALLEETSSKCAYCESPLRHIAYGDVEHIIPKAANPQLRFLWENLTIACDVCNTNKAEDEVIDPYLENPADVFAFFGPLVWASPESERATITEARLDLNRMSLVERRAERLEFLRNLVNSSHNKPDDVRVAILLKAKRECGSDKPYSAVAAAALNRLEAELG